MVVFTCNHCGDSLQKPKVEKHYQFQCRNGKNLTCVDCHKDFIGEDYTVHIKCISEEERYGAKGALNNTIKKGEVKQESWIAMIHSIIASETNIKPHLKKLLEILSKHTNVPRKRNKFFNFMKSVQGNKIADRDIEAIWNIIEKHKPVNKSNGENDKKSENIKNDPTAANGENESSENITTNSEEKVNKKKKKTIDTESKSVVDDAEKPKKKKKHTKNQNDSSEQSPETIENNKTDVSATNGKNENNENVTNSEKKNKNKRKVDDESSNIVNEEVEKPKKKKKPTKKQNDSEQLSETIENDKTNGSVTETDITREKFDFEAKILDILSNKNTVSLEKLDKKLLKLYTKEKGEIEDSQKVTKKFHKKLKKMNNVVIEDGIVTLKV